MTSAKQDAVARQPSGPDPLDEVYPSALRQSECAAISKRREQVGLTLDPIFPAPTDDDRIGLALSGGGIRSATFCLGVIQALAGKGVLRRVDLLSTVSGGGFCGSMLGGLFQRAGKLSASAGTALEFVKSELGDLRSATMRWLRENGRYLAPNGAGDNLLWAAAIVRNWVALQTVIGGAALAIFSTLWLGRGFLQRVSWFQQLEAWGLPERGSTGIWLSPLWPLILVTLLVAIVPLGWGYWLTQRAKGGGPLLGVMFVTAVSALVLADPFGRHPGAGYQATAAIIGGMSVLSMVWWAVGSWIVVATSPQAAPLEPEERRQQARYLLTRWLATAMLVGLVTSIVFVADSLAQTIYLHLTESLTKGAAASSLGAAGAALMAQRIWRWVKDRWPSQRPGLPAQVLTWAGATVLVLILLIGLSIVTMGVALEWQVPPFAQHGPTGMLYRAPTAGQPVLGVDLYALGILAGAFTLFGLLASRIFGFLNLSSQQQMYSSRLVRAYLGTSNPRRRTGASAPPPSRAAEGDDLALVDYAPEASGGPLHIINVTVNETLSGTSQVEQRDRKGMGLAVGPVGVSVGARHHATWKRGETITLDGVAPTSGFKVWPAGRRIVPEPLTVGRWVGISGAAFTTGLGQHTSVATSLLCGILNVRLGYWWNSGVDPATRGGERVGLSAWGKAGETLNRWVPVQASIADELLARFHGPARRHWYLSDGGHFENTAAYELVRRRLPLIIVCDCGRDDDMSCEDLAGLTRKARNDLAADITFFEEPDLALLPESLTAKRPDGARLVGTLAEFRRRDGYQPKLSSCHATLAWIDYPHDDVKRRSLLLVLKPTLTGDEPLDVLQYGASQPDFPQQSTTDQFFDEAQWESYRALGEHCASFLDDRLAATLIGMTRVPSVSRALP